jgi:hypothetical protein
MNCEPKSKVLQAAANAGKKSAIRLRFGSIPMVDAEGMARLRRGARLQTTRAFPEMPEWRNEK